MSSTPSEGIKISELTTGTKDGTEFVATARGGVSEKVLLTGNTYNITAGMTWAQISAVFDQAQAVKNTDVTIQFADSTAYTQTGNYTFTNMGRVRILGNSANTGSGSGKAVKLTLSGGDYRTIFTNCRGYEVRYLEFSSATVTNYPFETTNSNGRILDCYSTNSSGSAGSFIRVNEGSYCLIQDSTNDNFDEIGLVTGGVLEYGDGNTTSNAGADPYFNVSGTGVIIDLEGTFVETDFSGNYSYATLGKTVNAGNTGTIRGRYIKSDGNASGPLTIQPDGDLNLVAGTSIYSSTLEASTPTAGTALVVVAGTGLITKTSSSIRYKTAVETMEKSYVDNIIDNLRPVYYKDKNDPQWSYYGLIAEEVALIEPRFVHFKRVDKVGTEIVEAKDKDGNTRLDKKGDPVMVEQPKYVPREVPEPESVDYARMVAPLLFKVKELETRLKKLEII